MYVFILLLLFCYILKDLISDRSRWRQDSKWECMPETCWQQQRTKEVHM